MNIKNFKYDEVGLNRFFGPLESKIMEIIWAAEEISIKEVQQMLEIQDRSFNFNTVMTVMNRLIEKKVLKKRPQGRMYLYSPVQSKEKFIEEQSKVLTENLLDEFGDVVINHMIEALEEVDQQMLEKLEHKIKKLKRNIQS